MKKVILIALQAFLLLASNALFLFLLVEPQLEGRNAEASLFETYCTDPFLAYVYLASVPVFVGIFQVHKLLGYAAQDSFFSRQSIQATRSLRNCSSLVILFVVFSLLFMIFADPEDRPAGLFLRLLVVVPSGFIFWAAARLEFVLHKYPAAKLGRIPTL